METFNLAQLTKEMVVGQLRNIEDPTRLAAEVVRGTLIARLKGRKLSNFEIQEAVSEICRGAIQGMILMKCHIARGAARTLMAAEAAAREARVDQELVAIAAIKGISDARRFVTPDALGEIRQHVEGVRHGGGQVLDHFCVDLCAHQSHPDYIPAGI